MRKGQAEFIAILGIIIVAVVAILFASQTITPTQPVTQEQKSIMNSLENLIRSAADESLRELSVSGGYSESPADSVLFLNKQTPYWQKSGVSNIPNIKQNFQESVKNYINQQKDTFVSGLSGEIIVKDATVSANFLNDKIVLNVNLPATHNNNPIPSQYNVEILTKFGEILEFSEGFVQAQNQNRYIEYFILGSIIMSPIEDEQFTVPLMIQLTDCGQYVFKTWYDIKPAMEERIKTTLSHIYMPEKSPTNVGDITPYPKYVIPRINNKPYLDLDVSFHLPDDFELDPTSLQFTPNPISSTAEPIPFVGICTADPVIVNYFINIPVIVRVKDPITNNVFQFAEQVFIKNNKPGQWTSQDIYEQEERTLNCENPGCDINLDVTTPQGDPVPYADVMFMSCDVGNTDSSGNLQAKIPCGAGVLNVFMDGYEHYETMHTYTELKDIDIELNKKQDIDVSFYKVSVVNNTLANQYQVNGIEAIEDLRVMLELKTTEGPTKIYTRTFDSFSGTLSGIPEGTYALTAMLVDKEMTTMYGTAMLFVVIDKEMEDMYVYIPYNLETSQLQDTNEMHFANLIYSSVLNNCDIGPISSTPLDEESLVPCFKEYNEV